MNDSQRNRTLGFLERPENMLTDKQIFDAGWNSCAQDVLDTLGVWATALSDCGDSSEKFESVQKELATYFARLKGNEK